MIRHREVSKHHHHRQGGLLRQRTHSLPLQGVLHIESEEVLREEKKPNRGHQAGDPGGEKGEGRRSEGRGIQGRGRRVVFDGLIKI